MVRPALFFIALEPLFLAARSVAQGILMKAKRTEAFLLFSPAKIALVAVIGFAVVSANPDVNGALLGTLLFLGGDCFDGIVYSLRARSLIAQGAVFSTPAD